MARNGNYGLFSPQEVLATQTGIKPVTRKGVNNKFDPDRLRTLLDDFELEIELREMNSKGPADSGNYLYISKDREMIDKAFRAEKNDRMLDLGELLGYPECCIKNYVERLKDYDSGGERIRKISESSSEFFWENNIIYTFDTRIIQDIGQRKMDELIKLNDKSLYLNVHLPCSFDCENSRKNARKLLDKLEEEEKEFAARIPRKLSNPVVFIDNFSWITFQGEVSNSEILYSEVSEDSMISCDELERGDRVKVGENIEVFRGEKKIETIETDHKPLILPFGG